MVTIFGETCFCIKYCYASYGSGKVTFGAGDACEEKSKNCQDITFTNEKKRFIIDDSSKKL